MALAIDASSPATAVNTSFSATLTVTTASFTPPANSLLVVLWSADEPTGPAGTPSITDSRGTPLTYTLQQFCHGGSPTPSNPGQAAIWTAPVPTSSAMTITVTNNVTVNGFDSALRVLVITDGGQPTVGTSSKNSATGTSMAMTYTATQTGSWGFGCYVDWDEVTTPSGGTGTTLIDNGDTGNVRYGFARRTTADGSSGSATTLNLNLTTSSAHMNWAAVEILPNAGGGSNFTSTVNDTTGSTDYLSAATQGLWTFTHNVTIG